MKMLWPGAHKNLTFYFPQEQLFNIHEFIVYSDFIEHNYCEKQELTLSLKGGRNFSVYIHP